MRKVKFLTSGAYVKKKSWKVNYLKALRTKRNYSSYWMRKERDKATGLYNDAALIIICAVKRVKIKPSRNADQKFMVLFMKFNGNF